MKLFRTLKSKTKGSALLAALVIVVIMGSVIGAMMASSSSEVRQTMRKEVYDQSNSGAKSAIAAMTSSALYLCNEFPPQLDGSITMLDSLIQQIEAPNQPKMEVLDSYVVRRNPTATGDPFTYEEINDPNEYWFGYVTGRLDYDIVAQVRENSENAESFDSEGVAYRRRLTVDYIPMYAYAIFYYNYLELHPGPAMDITGRVHSNGMLRLDANADLKFWDTVTAAGNFYHGAGETWNRGGNVWFPTGELDNNGNKKLDKVDGKWQQSSYFDSTSPYKDLKAYQNRVLDSQHPEWLEKSAEYWNGNMRDRAWGVNAINPPLPQNSDPRTMIERVADDDPAEVKAIKFEHNASVKVYADPVAKTVVVKDKDGNIIDHEYEKDGQTKSFIEWGNFWDGREERWVYTVDLNMNNFNEAMDEGNIPSFEPGIVYVSTPPKQDANKVTESSTVGSSKLSAVRVRKAEKLPADSTNGFTLATDRPVYTEGDINTQNARGKNTYATSLIAGDAVTVTSKHLTLNTRSGNKHGNASETETRTVFLMGNVPTKPSPDTTNQENWVVTNNVGLSGGAHNVMRYLEDWSGKKHIYDGSILVLWENEIARGYMQNQGRPGHYNPPRRHYNWDSSLSTRLPPPGMPVFLFVTEGELERLSPEEVEALKNPSVTEG